MYIDAFVALLIVIGLIFLLTGGMRALSGQKIIPRKPLPPGVPPLEVTDFHSQTLGGEHTALFMEFRGTRYVVLQNKQNMILLETIRLAPPPKKEKDK